MGLISKEITVKWNSANVKHFVEKGYTYTKKGDEFVARVEDLNKGSNFFVKVQCEECGKIQKMTFNNYYHHYGNEHKYYCNKCSTKMTSPKRCQSRILNSISLGDWIIKNLPVEKSNETLSRWDYEKNNCSPFDICYGTGRKFWFKCLNCIEHSSEEKIIASYIKGYRINKNIDFFPCKQCNTVFYKYPELVKYFVNMEDSKKYSFGSRSKVILQCPNCKYAKTMRINDLCQHGFSCPKCSDGYTYPNKFGFNVLDQLNIKFKPEYRPKWANGRRYDFYFKKDNKSYILEMDGGWHFIDNPLSGQTKEESNNIDMKKSLLAEQHGIHVIRIDCRKSESEKIKDNLLDSDLSGLFDLSIIDWNKCCEYALSSLVYTVCSLWNNCHKISDIVNLTKLARGTIRKYLKRGASIELCDYDSKKEIQKRIVANAESHRRKIICLTTGIIFQSISEASTTYGIGISSIIDCANGKHKYSGKHPITGEELHWMYYDEYIKLKNN